ncbi:DUF6461 domain-containing protein [Streptomyces sp. LHD-70]|uniref:DUF6461 domain-containing protein n=1 Tax=Streptomyces sp. LHD-70 TaxID=3072140 RepID=UPI00280E4122|nr:DUF6461 domain-containing protein [Streptomyces sp. LHD-70]MDQ8705406.1 DUF6461 domain-containing protein [Streptomyces sp. LHD-70]
MTVEFRGGRGTEVLAWLREFSDLGYCLTLTRERSAEQVMRAYGIDPASARRLPLDDLKQVDPTGELRGTVVRFGQSEGLGFSVEYIGTTGGSDPVLGRLSAGTETVTLTATADGMVWFGHACDGVELSTFEPHAPDHTRNGPGPHQDFAEPMQQLADWYEEYEPDRTKENLLGLIHERLGGLPSPDVLDGPLLTAFLPED